MPTEFGKKLKELREAKNLTQPSLAASLGVTTRQVQRYELFTIPRPEKIKVLNRIFKFDFFTLMDDFKSHASIDDPLPLGDLNVTLRDYFEEIKQQKEFLQELLLNKVEEIDSNLKKTLGGVLQSSLHSESAREVVLESLTRLEKKPKGFLKEEADNTVIRIMKERKKQGSYVGKDT